MIVVCGKGIMLASQEMEETVHHVSSFVGETDVAKLNLSMDLV